MTELRIIKGDCWYSKFAGKKFPILGFSPELGFLVLEDEYDTKWYVKTSDCEIDTEPKEEEQELLIKLIPNSEGKCVDMPVKLEQGDWIDLRACIAGNEVTFTGHGKVVVSIPLGVSIKLPEGYEAIIAPRSSLFKRYGLTLVNSIGVIDGKNKYS